MSYKLHVTIWLFVLIVNTLHSQTHLQNGDLLFVKTSHNEMSEAITMATSTSSQESFDHVAITYYDSVYYYVIEATPESGVVCRLYSDFINDHGIENVVAMRYHEEIDFQKVIRTAFTHVGKAYDFTFLPNNDKFYCSELIYSCFTDSNNHPVFEAKPMNFRASDGTMPEYWQHLFQSLNMPIPEGILGTNPNDLSQDKQLYRLYK